MRAWPGGHGALGGEALMAGAVAPQAALLHRAQTLRPRQQHGLAHLPPKRSVFLSSALSQACQELGTLQNSLDANNTHHTHTYTHTHTHRHTQLNISTPIYATFINEMKDFLPYRWARNVTAISYFGPPNVSEGSQKGTRCQWPSRCHHPHGDC